MKDSPSGHLVLRSDSHPVRMRHTRFHLAWAAKLPRAYRTGVSLHSHTAHSKELLDFLYKIARHSAALRFALRRGETQYRQRHGEALDLTRGWWTPPLAPLDAYRLEAGQLEGLGLAPMVSLTDHDDIEAPMSLQAVDPAREVPVSVEWTVPYGPTFFHLGVHNLPPREARSILVGLAAFTVDPRAGLLRDLLATLHAKPDVLLVLNHPLWDEKGVGDAFHRETAEALLHECGEFLHAIEMNGLRPWRENQDAIRLAGAWNKPVISGGDRHAVEPNAVLNLTGAATFAEFVEEIREGASQVLVTEQYRQAHASRILHNIIDVLGSYDNHGYGWREWPDRLFYQCKDNVARSLRELWGDRAPGAVTIFDGLMRLAGNGSIRSAVRAVSCRAQQVIL